MKKVKRTHMASIEAETLSDFSQKFNSVMDWVSRTADSYKDPVIDLDTLRGYVIYEEIERMPEGYRDIFDLYNTRICCESCTKFEHVHHGLGECEICKGNIRRGDEVCDRFYKEWENGNCWLNEEAGTYQDIISEYEKERRLKVG